MLYVYDVYLCMQQVCDTVYICVHVHVQCVRIYAPGPVFVNVCKCVYSPPPGCSCRNIESFKMGLQLAIVPAEQVSDVRS